MYRLVWLGEMLYLCAAFAYAKQVIINFINSLINLYGRFEKRRSSS